MLKNSMRARFAILGLLTLLLAGCGNGSSEGASIGGSSILSNPFNSAPTILEAVAKSINEIQLSWKDNSNDEEVFRIERKKSGESFQEVATAPANDTEFMDQELEPATLYIYRMRAENNQGLTSYSEEVQATTLAINTEPPGPPQNLTIQNRSMEDLGAKWKCSFEVTWQPPATHPTGEDITYEFCIELVGSGQSNCSLILPEVPTTTSRTIIIGKGEFATERYTLTAINGEVRGESNSFQEPCPQL